MDPANTAQVQVPLHLDYPLLEQLLLSQMFTDASGRREILNDPSGCSEILLSEPQLGAKDTELELLAKLNARIGFGSPGACATMLTWRGRIGIRGVPEIRREGTALEFVPGKSGCWTRLGNGSTTTTSKAWPRAACARS